MRNMDKNRNTQHRNSHSHSGLSVYGYKGILGLCVNEKN